MGGKRPDQYQIDPSEAGATDYKNLPQTGRGHSSLDDTVELDRQRRAISERETRGSPAPERKPPPSRDANERIRSRGAEEGPAASAQDPSN